MKILVIGHLCFDVIHPTNGPEIESYGGIYYSVATLASLLEARDTVVPVFGVHKDDYKQVLDDLAQYPNVDTSGIFRMDQPTNRVHLYYQDATSRIECSRDIAPPIPYSKIRRHLSVDGILLNMVSGFDVTIETLDHIRMAVRSHNIPIHFDYHSLTLGVRPNLERVRRPVEDWRRWIFMVDTVQLNEEEIAGLTFERMNEYQTVGHMLTLCVKGVLVTRGERGVALYYNDHKHVIREDIEGIKVENPKDVTGCGDVFGAAFLVSYVRKRDLKTAARFANRVAAAKVEHPGADGLSMLRTHTASA
jgi:sugar/nucleoside kinase (ribokinase family)